MGSTTATVGTRDVGCELSSATLGKESGKETEAEWSSSVVIGGVVGDHFRDRLLPPLFIEDVQATLAWACRRPLHILHNLREVISTGAESGRGVEAALSTPVEAVRQCEKLRETLAPETSDASAPRRRRRDVG